MTGGAVAPRPLPAVSPRRALARLGAAAVVLLGGCTTLTPPPASTGDTLSGRLALRVAAQGVTAERALSAAFDLRGSAQAGTLSLATPLGSTLAEARWSPAEVVLVTPQGTRRFTDLDALTEDVLGERVPVEAWFDWLRGRPWPGAPSTPLAEGAPGFAQLGWRVDLARFGEGTVSATRDAPLPVVTVRIRLDRG